MTDNGTGRFWLTKTAEGHKVSDFINMIVKQLKDISDNEELWIAKGSLKFEFTHDKKQFNETAALWAKKYA